MTDVAAAAAGDDHSLALKTDGSLWEWGGNWEPSRPSQVMNRVAAMAAGEDYSLALRTDGTLWGWGWNAYGQIGDGTTTDRPEPVFVIGRVVAVAVGAWNSFALKADGTLWAWGWDYGPRPAALMDRVTALASGDDHTLVRKADGSLRAWGDNSSGQLGDGTRRRRAHTVHVMNGVSALAVGLSHSLAFRDDGSLWAWGWNRWGQIGVGPITKRYVPWPTPVVGFGPVNRPTAPTALTATVRSPTQILLQWQDTSADEQGFRLARKVGAGAWTPLTDVAANTTRLAETGLVPNTRYRYRVQAFNLRGVSANATSAPVTTPP
jgi:alpha-tubulin suppressor-like RCC1 family protein